MSQLSSSKKKITKFINCHLIRNGKIIKDDLWVRGGKIINPEPLFYEERLIFDFVVDCHGSIIAPGFIDVQINGKSHVKVMPSSRGNCINDPDTFRYIYGCYMLVCQRHNISNFVIRTYKTYFDVPLGDQEEHENDVPRMDSESADSSSDAEQSLAPHCFNQEDLNDLMRDLALSKKAAELLASRLSEKHICLTGGFGFDFSSDDFRINEALATVSKGILASGVTSFCPTIVTSPKEIYHKVIPQIERKSGGQHGAGVLGIHLEGPFISPQKKGAHPINFIRGFDEGFSTLVEIYGNLKNVAMVTLAPELPNAEEVIKKLVQDVIVVSVGHSNGNLLDGERAVKCGASFITHLFNAMLPFHHRDPGLVGLLTSQYIRHPIFYGIIADGIHTHPAALRIAHRTHPEGLVLVTDAMAALGLGEGLHQIGQLEVEVKGRRAFLRGTDTLAGSIAPMNECIRRFVKAAGVGLVEGVEAASLHPAQALGLAGKKGTLAFGADADFVLLNSVNREAVGVLHTLIAGECTFSSPQATPLIFAPT